MKKLFLFLIAVLPLALTAQQKTDTVKLKNGETVSGYIYKMDGGKVYIARTTDSLVYNANEVQSLMFCHTVRGSEPCASTSSSPESNLIPGRAGSSRSYSNTSIYSSLDDNSSPGLFPEKGDDDKGIVTFRCNMCGGSGKLLVNGANAGSKSTATYTFTMEKDKHFFVYAVKLLPGEYNWKYCDTNNNATNGKLIIGKGEERKIVLFENE